VVERDEWVNGGFHCTWCELAGRRWDLGCLALIHLSWTSKGHSFPKLAEAAVTRGRAKQQLVTDTNEAGAD